MNADRKLDGESRVRQQCRMRADEEGKPNP